VNNNSALFFLFFIFVISVVYQSSFAESQVNVTTHDGINSTSIELNEIMKVGDNTTNPDGTNSTSIELDETMKVGDNTTSPKDVLSPLKQIKNGVSSENVVCKQGLKLAFKLDGQVACVKITSIEKLITRGWAR